MRLITEGGRRIDRRDELTALCSRPLKALTATERQRIVDLLAFEHQQREARRWRK